MNAPLALLALLATLATAAPSARGASSERPVEVDYAQTPPAPARQTRADVDAKSTGCRSCHTETDAPSMHRNPAVTLGCTDCHGGDASVVHSAARSTAGGKSETEAYTRDKRTAHVQPRFPHAWAERGAGNPVRSYTLLNREAPEYVRFVNPGDLRVAREACGACHVAIIEAVERSLMSTGAMFWGGAAFNNGILPFKRYILGEAYTRTGEPAALQALVPPTAAEKVKGILPALAPLPAWETIPPADNFRVFERGGRTIISQFPEIGNPNLIPNTLEEPGKPDIRQSNRGPGTGSRISVPALNLHKTRLNDPLLWFLGTNDNPGDFRSSGCTSCHTVYANDRDPRSAGSYAQYGHWGQTITTDPTIRDRRGADGELERGHPLRHEFTRAIPTSTCMVCHMHQPNMFLNSYLGYTMWDYESDAPLFWPDEQRYPGIEAMRAALERNPEGAVVRGKWADLDFLSSVWTDVNPAAEDTQFADYHGHGWNFRAIFKRARDGTLLDAENRAVPDDLPPAEKWRRAVHLRDIHLEYGMQCVDCHFAQDAHGTGHLYGEVAAQVEIRCRDCHGTVDEYATLSTSGPAAPQHGNDLGLLRNIDGKRRFMWRDGTLYQRLALPPHDELAVTQVKDSIDRTLPACDGSNNGARCYNAKSARAKTLATGTSMAWGAAAAGRPRAHDADEMACFSCHSSWMTSCAGCHLPIEANWKSERHHYEGGATRNYATYNPQAARDQMFQLGRHGEVKNGIIAPMRSSSALLVSSTDANRNRIYVQQPPISSSGYSSQAFAPHFPHTVRKTETKTCTDCHLSEANDNNAIMAQLMGLGTGFVNFVGFHAYVGTAKAIEAIQVTEWDEPQAVVGSYLHRHAYPDWYQEHVAHDRNLENAIARTERRPPHHRSNQARCLQLRGEYLYVAEGANGMQVYDVSSVANKGFSERIITAPFSPLGHDTRVESTNATCVALPTNQPIRPERNRDPLQTTENLEQPMHPIYSYAAITDAAEGLILTNVETMGDFEPRNNFLKRDLVWNPDGLLDGATHAVFAGHILYVSAARGIVVVDLDRPLEPKALAVIPLVQARAAAVQLRYLFVVDTDGLKVVDVTHPARPRIVEKAFVPLAHAHRLYVARTYVYVAAGPDGLVIVDVERPEHPRVHVSYTADGTLDDTRDVVVGTTNASLFAYVADGGNGLKVIQLTSPELQPKFYGFSPAPNPALIAWHETDGPALAVSRGLDRDRAVDETGHQIAVVARLGARPFTLAEMQRFFLDADGEPWTVHDDVATPPGPMVRQVAADGARE